MPGRSRAGSLSLPGEERDRPRFRFSRQARRNGDPAAHRGAMDRGEEPDDEKHPEAERSFKLGEGVEEPGRAREHIACGQHDADPERDRRAGALPRPNRIACTLDGGAEGFGRDTRLIVPDFYTASAKMSLFEEDAVERAQGLFDPRLAGRTGHTLHE